MTIEERAEALKELIRDVPDFPKPGILFKDITPLLGDAGALRRAGDLLAVVCGDRKPTRVAAIESRGFILGGMVADRLGVGFVPLRKPGKLPAATVRASYALEYGEDAIEMHADGVAPGDRVLVVDDVIATGGTARAAAELVEKVGGTVAGFAFLVELTFLGGRRRIEGYDVASLIRF